MKAPKGPASGFGKEHTLGDYLARIEWETWAAAQQRKKGCEATAQGHDLTRVAYQEMVARKFPMDLVSNQGEWGYGDPPNAASKWAGGK